MPDRRTCFVLLTKSRSGSKWLVELLDSHGDIAVFGELFGSSSRGYGADGVPDLERYVQARRGVLPIPVLRASYLRMLFAARPAARAVGVKVMYGHAGRGIFEYLTLRRARVLHLIRANVFGAVISYEVAKARSRFDVRERDVVPPLKVSLDPATLRVRLEQHEFSIEQARARIQLYHLPWLEVFYEELVGRREETLKGILRFLGVRPGAEGLRSTFVPVDDVPRASVLDNLDQIRETLSGTRFEWMLRDPAGAASRGTPAR